MVPYVDVKLSRVTILRCATVASCTSINLQFQFKCSVITYVENNLVISYIFSSAHTRLLYVALI